MANKAHSGEKYEVFISYKLSAQRKLEGFPVKLARKHSHVFRIDLRLEAAALDERGVTADFYDVKKCIGGAIGDLQDSFLNEIPDFVDESVGEAVNPTGEVVARVLWDRIEPALAESFPNLKLKVIYVAESPSCKIIYSR